MTSTAKTAPLDPIAKDLLPVQELIASGQLPQAAERLNATRKRAPKDPRVFLMGMRLAEAAGNSKGAEESARKAVELEPTWPVAVAEYAALLARQGRFPEAIGFAGRAVSLDPGNPGVLARMIDLAHHAQETELALGWLVRLSALMPQKTGFELMMATDLRHLGRNDEAIELYSKLLELQPDNAAALFGRAQALHAKGDDESSVRDCETLLAREPGNEEYKFLHLLASGRTPLSQPTEVVKKLFDPVADTFDMHMVVGLKYRLPKQVAGLIKDRYPELKLNVLDLGCGTGLLGVCLGRIQGAMVGVDVSEAMTAKALWHQVYDRIHHVNVLDALRETPDSLYDVIACLDVFIYVGLLTNVIPDAYRILVPGGHLIFSCETAGEDEADLVLRATGRYAHKRSHVEALCRSAGFADVAIEDCDLRMEQGTAIAGFLVIARKPAA